MLVVNEETQEHEQHPYLSSHYQHAVIGHARIHQDSRFHPYSQTEQKSVWRRKKVYVPPTVSNEDEKHSRPKAENMIGIDYSQLQRY